MAFLIRRRHPSAISCSTFSPSKNSCVVTERDRLRELMSISAFVKRLFDGLSKLHVINDALVELLGIAMGDHFREDFGGPILDGAQDTEQPPAGEAAP